MNKNPKLNTNLIEGPNEVETLTMRNKVRGYKIW